MLITSNAYFAGFVAYFLLAFMLGSFWRGRLNERGLTAACWMMAIWAGGIALQERYNALSVPLVWTLETFHSLIWLFFLWRMLSGDSQAGILSKPNLIHPWYQAGLVVGLALVAFIWGMHYFRYDYPLIFQPNLQLLGHVGLAIMSLILVEQIYRNTRTDQRWRIKLLCISLGFMFVYELYLYSEAILFNRVSVELWAARGLVVLFIVPFIAISARRNPSEEMDIFVSREVVFHSTALLGAGAYLLLMASAGYYLRFYGGGWSIILQIAFLIAAIVFLTLVLFSGQIRAKIRIFLTRYLFSHSFDYRQEWQRMIATLSENSSLSLEQRVIIALSQIVQSPGGILWTRNEAGKFIWRTSYGYPGINVPEIDGDDPLISFLERKDAVVNLNELLTMPEAYEGLNKPHWIEPYEQAWILVPLWKTGGGLDGVVLLIESRTFKVWNLEVIDLLKTSSRLVASYLELEAAARALAEARQFAGFNRLSAFVIHDLKNLIAQLSLVVRNAAKYHDNPEFMRDAIKTVEHAVGKMNALMSQLRNSNSAAAAKNFDLRDALNEAVEARKRQLPSPFCSRLNVPVMVKADRQRLTSALEHIIHNAQDAAGKQGWVKVSLSLDDGKWAMVEIEDNGGGMTPEFIANRLFKPFETTKGLTGMGIGAYESRELARAMGGDLSVRSEPGKGSLFTFKIPFAEQYASIFSSVGEELTVE